MTAHPIQYESMEQAAQREQNATPPFYLQRTINYPYTDCCSVESTPNDSRVKRVHHFLQFRAAPSPAFHPDCADSGSFAFLPVQRAGRAYSEAA